jgi:hypothetical protein
MKTLKYHSSKGIVGKIQTHSSGKISMDQVMATIMNF